MNRRDFLRLGAGVPILASAPRSVIGAEHPDSPGLPRDRPQQQTPRLCGVDAFNYVIGTQTIGATYKFIRESVLVETARAILDMGSNILKITMGRDYRRMMLKATQAAYPETVQYLLNQGSDAKGARGPKRKARESNPHLHGGEGMLVLHWPRRDSNPQHREVLSQGGLPLAYRAVPRTGVEVSNRLGLSQAALPIGVPGPKWSRMGSNHRFPGCGPSVFAARPRDHRVWSGVTGSRTRIFSVRCWRRPVGP